MNTRIRVAALVCLAEGSAFAEGVEAAAEQKEEPRTVSVTMAPAATLAGLALGGVLVMGEVEVRATEHVGVGVMGAGGEIPELFGSGSIRMAVAAVKAQYYAREFSGLHAGAMLGAGVGASTGGTGLFGGMTEPEDVTLIVAAPFVGWKYVARGGFTVTTQLGVQIGAARGEDGEVTVQAVPMANAGIGYSF